MRGFRGRHQHDLKLLLEGGIQSRGFIGFSQNLRGVSFGQSLQSAPCLRLFAVASGQLEGELESPWSFELSKSIEGNQRAKDQGRDQGFHKKPPLVDEAVLPGPPEAFEILFVNSFLKNKPFG